MPDRGGAWRRLPGELITRSWSLKTTYLYCAQNSVPVHCCRIPCNGGFGGFGSCACGSSEGHPKLAALVEAEKLRREIELFHFN